MLEIDYPVFLIIQELDKFIYSLGAGNARYRFFLARSFYLAQLSDLI